jgi:hypothetical protein
MDSYILLCETDDGDIYFLFLDAKHMFRFKCMLILFFSIDLFSTSL